MQGDDFTPDYKLIRSKRKTLSICVDKDGTLIVKAPYGLPEERINGFISEKTDWIEKHTNAAKQRTDKLSARLSVPPSELPLLGGFAPVSHEKPYGLIDNVFHLPEGMTLNELLPYLRRLYTLIAKDRLIPNVWQTAERMGINIAAVKINSAKTRWGSCSAQKSINLSRNLVAADPKLIEYVIVHELCHTAHMDHSPAFWEMVSRYIPDYKERREALKEVQTVLSEFGLE